MNPEQAVGIRTPVARMHRGRLAVSWMIGFGALHAAGAIAAAIGIGPFTGVGAVIVNSVYTVVSLVGAGVADAITRPDHSLIPGWFVYLGAILGTVTLAFVGSLAVIHQVGGVLGVVDQSLAALAFEVYVLVGAALFVPTATRHLLRRSR